MVDSKRKARFEAGGQADSKRRRVSRACDQCRAAREKCDGIQPTCFACASSNRDCSYTSNPKRRGIQPGYIRTLVWPDCGKEPDRARELILAWTITNVEDCKHAITGLLRDTEGQELISSADSPIANQLHDKWRAMPVYKAIDRVLAGEELGNVFDDTTTSTASPDDDEDGSSSLLLPFRDSVTVGDAVSVHASDSRLAVSAQPAGANTGPSPSRRSSGTSDGEFTVKAKLPPNHWRLIDVYFAYSHSWLPIVDKEHVLKLCYSYPASGLTLTLRSESADHAELWSLLSLASVQCASVDKESETSVLAILNTAEALSRSVGLDVGHAGAALHLALIYIALRKFNSAFLLLGRAGRIARVLWSAESARTVRLRNIILACFVVDTILAARLDLVPSLRSDFARYLGLVPEEGLDEWQPWSGCDGFCSNPAEERTRSTFPSQAKSTFNQFLKLCYVLNDRLVARKLGQPPSSQATTLSQWLSSLPQSLGPLHSLSREQSSPQKFQLFLAFLVERTRNGPESETTVEETLVVLDQFAYLFGTAAMPPLFACFLDMLMRTAQGDGFQHNRLAGIFSRFAGVWKDPAAVAISQTPIDPAAKRTGPTLSPVTPMHAQDRTPRLQASLASNLTPNPSIPSPKTPSHLVEHYRMHPSSTTATESRPVQSSALAGYDAGLLGRAPSNRSMDLDAFLNDFTPYDAAAQDNTTVP